MMNILERLSTGLEVGSPEAMEACAGELAACLPVDHVLALSGDLGAGKTTFVRGLARAWGIAEPILSPTFNLYYLYHGQRQLVHMDAYRLEKPEEIHALMLEEFLQSPWCLALEWPEKVDPVWLRDAWHLDLSILKYGRHFIRLRTA